MNSPIRLNALSSIAAHRRGEAPLRAYKAQANAAITDQADSVSIQQAIMQ
jgi:hypothetical protein